jgi:D-sedoheptulose 7-phosphate isomerase
MAAAAHERMATRGGDAIVAAAEAMIAALTAGKSILVFGNGGSAADAQHFAAELVVRYERERRGLAAIALTTDASILTAAGNDRGFDQVFARQVEALGRAGDVALAITTSGASANVVGALEAAIARGMVTIALTGRDGGRAGRLATIHVNVPEARTAVVQEVHTTVLHAWCEVIEEELGEELRTKNEERRTEQRTKND